MATPYSGVALSFVNLGNPEGRGAGRLRPPHSPSQGALPESVRPEPVEACPEGTRRGPPAVVNPPHQQPAAPLTPSIVVPTRKPGTPPLAPGGTLTRPYCPHTGASATLSPWQSQSLTATRTSRVPMPSGPPAYSLVAWSASMVRGGSASIRRGCLYSAKNFGFVAEMRQTSYKSNAKTTSPLATVAPPRTPTHLIGAIRESDHLEPVEACPEGTRREPSHAQRPHTLTPTPRSNVAPPVILSPWQSQSPTATRTSRVPMPSGAPALSLAAWSALMDRGASASIRGGVSPLQKNSWIYS